MVVNLGPMALPLYNGTTETGTIMDYNPRCLVRDVSADINTAYANSTSMVNLITQNDNIADFQNIMQGALGSADLGVHGGGHYTIGGNPGDDVYISPGDPVFYLHVSFPPI
jgi:tyrosinase